MNRVGLLIVTTVGSCFLTACTHASSHVTQPPIATLSIHLGMFGSGRTGANAPTFSNSPLVADITAVDANGAKHTATSDANGTATLQLPPGRYTVFPARCAAGSQQIDLTANQTARLQFVCPVA